MELLRRAQHVLIAAVDEGSIDSNRLLQLLSSSESMQASCSEFQDACRAVAKWGPASCPSCLAAKEERCRSELGLKEVSSRQCIAAAWGAFFATRQYCTVQCMESESERMWHEDMLSHYATLQQMQRELTTYQRAAQRIPYLEEEALFWKDEAALLSKKHASQLEDLGADYERRWREWKQSFLGNEGNTNMLRWLLVSNVKSFHAHGKLLFSAAVQRKHLCLLKKEVSRFGHDLKAQLRDLEMFCMQSLRRIAPQEWKSVPVESTPTNHNRIVSVHPPVLSAYARNAIVIKTAAKGVSGNDRSEGAPRTAGRRSASVK